MSLLKKLSYEGKEPDRVVVSGRGNGRGSLFNGACDYVYILREKKGSTI